MRRVGVRRAVGPVTRLAAALAAALAVAACGDEPSAAGDLTGGAARIQIVNGTPSAISVAVDGATAIASLAPATISAPLAIAPGGRAVELRPLAGGSASTTQLATTAGDTALVAALGTVANAVTAVALPDTGATPAAGMSKVQAIHLAATAPAIWVWRTQPDYPFPVRFQFPHPYGQATPFYQSTAGTWTIYVTREGGDPTVSYLARLTLPVAANQARRVAVLDSTGGGVRIAPIDTP